LAEIPGKIHQENAFLGKVFFSLDNFIDEDSRKSLISSFLQTKGGLSNPGITVDKCFFREFFCDFFGNETGLVLATPRGFQHEGLGRCF